MTSEANSLILLPVAKASTMAGSTMDHAVRTLLRDLLEWAAYAELPALSLDAVNAVKHVEAGQQTIATVLKELGDGNCAWKSNPSSDRE